MSYTPLAPLNAQGHILPMPAYNFDVLDPDEPYLFLAAVEGGDVVHMTEICTKLAHLTLEAHARLNDIFPSPHRVALPFGYLFAAVRNRLQISPRDLTAHPDMLPYLRQVLLIGAQDAGPNCFDTMIDFMHIAVEAGVPLVSCETQNALIIYAEASTPQDTQEARELAYHICRPPMAEAFAAYGWEIDPAEIGS